MKGRDEIIIRQNWVGYGTNSVLDKADPGGEVGIIQQHAGGTIFLDEFHTTPPWFQTFLLQVLDRKQIPLAHGTGDPVVPDVRLIFASNKTLVELEASESPVQKDFLDRLRRWIIQVPPLRDRKEDIPSFVEKWCVGFRRDYRFLLALIRYDWPGNVRELHNLLDIAKRKAARASMKLTLDHLEIENSAVIEAVRQMPKVEAQREVMQFLVQTFKGQGLRKGKGLNKHLAAFYEVGESAMSKRLKSLKIDSK